jgi:uncharacterized protein YbbK (DUF523 family)
MENISDAKPRLGISARLLGQKVRFDAGHKRDYFLNKVLGSFVEWIPVCPEIDVGMGVPREPVRLVGNANEPGMIAERSGKNWTGAMKRFSASRAGELQRFNLSGCVFKKDSPSCGMERVKVYAQTGGASRNGRGLFAAAVMNKLGLLPVEEEGRLDDSVLRENFIERVFAHRRWQNTVSGVKSLRALVEFHTAHKFQLLTHSERYYRELGRVVANAQQRPVAQAYERYGRGLMEALRLPANAKKPANVLET